MVVLVAIVSVVAPVVDRLVGLNVTVASAGAPGAVNDSETGVAPAPQVSVPVNVPVAPGTALRVAGVAVSVTSSTVTVNTAVFTRFAEVIFTVSA